MKQGKTTLKVIMVVLTVMVASYILYSFVQFAGSGITTARAIQITAYEGVSTEGFLVRSEHVIPTKYQMFQPIREEGEKVAAGEQVAISLVGADAQERQKEIDSKKENLEQLRLALSYQTQMSSNSSIGTHIDTAVADFAAQVSQNRLAAAQTTGNSLKSLVLWLTLGGEGELALQQQIEGLEAEIADLQAAAVDVLPVIADHAGYYSTVTDGYEALLTPEILETITPEAFQMLWEAEPPTPPILSAGRLIDSHFWYYAALVDKTHLKDLRRGQELTVTLWGDLTQELQMTVVRKDTTGPDLGLLVLRCDQKLSDISTHRTLKADVGLNTYSGLRVPKKAICYDEESGSAGVYVLVNGKARWKDVVMVHDNGDHYIVELDQSSTDYLWPQDEIILETDGLYDGKVIENT